MISDDRLREIADAGCPSGTEAKLIGEELLSRRQWAAAVEVLSREEIDALVETIIEAIRNGIDERCQMAQGHVLVRLLKMRETAPSMMAS